MRLSEKTIKTIYEARQKDKDLDEALNEVSDAITGVLGVTETATRIDPPLNDSEEHKTFNAVWNSILLAHMTLDAVFEAVYG